MSSLNDKSYHILLASVEQIEAKCKQLKTEVWISDLEASIFI